MYISVFVVGCPPAQLVNFKYCNWRVGISSNRPPVMYVQVEPMPQNAKLRNENQLIGNEKGRVRSHKEDPYQCMLSLVPMLWLMRQAIWKCLILFPFDRSSRTAISAWSCTSLQMLWLRIENEFVLLSRRIPRWSSNLQIANKIIPAYSSLPSLARPTKINAGTIRYSPITADFWMRCSGNRRTTDPCNKAITTPVVTNIFAWSIEV